MKNLILILPLLLNSSFLNAQDNNFIYQGVKNIDAKIGINEDNKIQKVCSILFRNMKNYNYRSYPALSKISFYYNDKKLNLGNIVNNTRTQVEFENMIADARTHVNGNRYYVRYAFEGYELTDQSEYYWYGSSGTTNFNINFKSGVEINKIKYADLTYCYDCNTKSYRGVRPNYNIEVYDCNNQLINNIEITTPTTPDNSSEPSFVDLY
tara:strand:+ start:10232 stop:10858 length:627 start_codon:yes stop_codon:yes gene_type:complete